MCSLLVSLESTDAVAWHDDQCVTAATFLRDVAWLGERIQGSGPILNLCENRYRFLVTFVAALMKGRGVILPPNAAPDVLRAVAMHCLVVSDQAPVPEGMQVLHYPEEPGQVAELEDARAPLATQLAAILHTSGSTGVPTQHKKTWGSLSEGAHKTGERLGLAELAGATVVATVPAQHMFGLETTVALVLQWKLAVYAGRPLFPEDVRRALESVPGPRILVTTPLHLRACLQANLSFPPLAFVLSATAPLTAELAAQAENQFSCPVHEIYGSTETGALATRRTVEGPLWHPLAGVTLTAIGEGWQASASHLDKPVQLNDLLRLHPTGEFELLGRSSDLVKVAGKRASLLELNHHLLQVTGVEDGCFVVPDELNESTRLAAFVVGTELSESCILDELRRRLDPAFLPRPLRCVERLPRDETGKLPRAALLALLKGA